MVNLSVLFGSFLVPISPYRNGHENDSMPHVILHGEILAFGYFFFNFCMDLIAPGPYTALMLGLQQVTIAGYLTFSE